MSDSVRPHRWQPTRLPCPGDSPGKNKTKTIESCPIISWQIVGETKETVRDFIFCKMLAPWKKSYDQHRQHIKKQRHYFADKVCLAKAMVFPVIMYGCEKWTIKKAESRRIDAFELWCWRRLLRVPWTARRFNQSILKDISPEYSLEGLMLKLKL